MRVEPGRFSGFYDLEMCRVGCAAMQMASAVGCAEGDGEVWRAMRAGWEDAIGRAMSYVDLTMVLAGHHFLTWRVISRYLSYDGTPGTGFPWSSPADPVRYRRALEEAETMMGVAGATAS